MIQSTRNRNKTRKYNDQDKEGHAHDDKQKEEIHSEHPVQVHGNRLMRVHAIGQARTLVG